MSKTEFEKWMQQNGITAIDIASILRINPTTVNRFLSGDKVRPSTLANFERLVYGEISLNRFQSKRPA